MEKKVSVRYHGKIVGYTFVDDKYPVEDNLKNCIIEFNKNLDIDVLNELLRPRDTISFSSRSFKNKESHEVIEGLDFIKQENIDMSKMQSKTLGQKE